jgi:hypothetical protein
MSNNEWAFLFQNFGEIYANLIDSNGDNLYDIILYINDVLVYHTLLCDPNLNIDLLKENIINDINNGRLAFKLETVEMDIINRLLLTQKLNII